MIRSGRKARSSRRKSAKRRKSVKRKSVNRKKRNVHKKRSVMKSGKRARKSEGRKSKSTGRRKSARRKKSTGRKKSKRSIKFGGILSKVSSIIPKMTTKVAPVTKPEPIKPQIHITKVVPAPPDPLVVQKVKILSAPPILKNSTLVINNIDNLPMIQNYENIYQYYFDYISYLRKNFRFNDTMPDLKGIKPQISGIVYNTIQGKHSFIIQGNNMIYKGDDVCISEGTWGLKPLANFYTCKNGDITTHRFGTNISLEDNNQAFNTKIKTENGIDIIKKKIGANKILCISLISMCNNEIACNDISKYLASMKKKAEISLIEPSILKHLMDNSTNDFKVISFPLSNPSKIGNIINMFNFNKYKKQIINEKTDDKIKEIYNLIDVSSKESTFKSIVDVVKYYYDNMKDTYVLCFHCKSGKDRTSVFDAVVQATIAHLHSGKNIDYDSIKTESQKYLWYGLQIAYYGTGFVGLKLDSIPVAEHILGPRNSNLYSFYSGHANSAGSSA